MACTNPERAADRKHRPLQTLGRPSRLHRAVRDPVRRRSGPAVPASRKGQVDPAVFPAPADETLDRAALRGEVALRSSCFLELW